MVLCGYFRQAVQQTTGLYTTSTSVTTRWRPSRLRTSNDGLPPQAPSKISSSRARTPLPLHLYLKVRSGNVKVLATPPLFVSHKILSPSTNYTPVRLMCFQNEIISIKGQFRLFKLSYFNIVLFAILNFGIFQSHQTERNDLWSTSRTL